MYARGRAYVYVDVYTYLHTYMYIQDGYCNVPRCLVLSWYVLTAYSTDSGLPSKNEERNLRETSSRLGVPTSRGQKILMGRCQVYVKPPETFNQSPKPCSRLAGSAWREGLPEDPSDIIHSPFVEYRFDVVFV